MKKILLICLSVLSFNCLAADAPINVDNAYVRQAPPTQQVLAVFMTLNNDSDQPRALVRVEGDVADSIELHTHIHDNGVMRMRQVEKIDVPANGSIELQPGGFHIMLIGIKAPLSLGQEVELSLHFDDDSIKAITLPVKKAMAGMKMSSGKKMHSGMKMPADM